MLSRLHLCALTILLIALSLTLPAAAQTATPVPDAPPAAAARPNLPPIVSASVVPRRIVYLDAGPSAGVQVMADGTASEDPEGQALLWSSDVDGDGVFTAWFFRPEAMEPVTAPGPFLVTVRARDPFGAVGILQIPMLARRFGRSLVVSASGKAAFGTVNGQPAFVYDAGQGNIVITANDATDGSGRWNTVTVRPEDVVQKWLGMSEYSYATGCQLVEGWQVNVLCTFGLPKGRFVLRTMSSYNGISGHCGDAEVVRVNGEPAPTLGLINNMPAVLYCNNNALTLLLENWTAGAGAPMLGGGFELLWSHDVGPAAPHTHSAIVQVGDRLNLPAYVYLDAAKAQLMYTVNQQPDGRGKWDVYPIEMQANDTGAPSLAMIAGRPAVAYRDGFNGQLKYALNDRTDGRGKWQISAVYAPTKAPAAPLTQSLAGIGGRAAIAFEDAERGLLFAYDGGAGKGNYWPVAIVDSRSYPGIRRDPVLIDVDGLPAIGYGPYPVQFAVAR